MFLSQDNNNISRKKETKNMQLFSSSLLFSKSIVSDLNN